LGWQCGRHRSCIFRWYHCSGTSPCTSVVTPKTRTEYSTSHITSTLPRLSQNKRAPPTDPLCMHQAEHHTRMHHVLKKYQVENARRRLCRENGDETGRGCVFCRGYVLVAESLALHACLVCTLRKFGSGVGAWTTVARSQIPHIKLRDGQICDPSDRWLNLLRLIVAVLMYHKPTIAAI